MEYTKIRLLRVLDILRETDEDHPFTANQIVHQLELYGIIAERKAVLRDVAALQDYGFDILLHADNKLGYYLAHREFEDWELKILMDAAAGASFLTDENSRKLAEKICNLASDDSRKTLRSVTPLSSQIKNGDTTTKNSIDLLLTAIRKKKQVGFQYTYTGSDLKKHMRFEGHEYPVSPYALIWRQDKYFLVGSYGSYNKLSYYRLDRIRNLRVTDNPIVPAESFLGPNPGLRIQEFVDHNLFNFSGEVTHLRLVIDETRADLLVDTFGENFTVENRAEGKLTVRTTVSNGWGLMAWLMQHGDCVQILEPQSVREEFIQFLNSVRSKYEAGK